MPSIQSIALSAFIALLLLENFVFYAAAKRLYVLGRIEELIEFPSFSWKAMKVVLASFRKGEDDRLLRLHNRLLIVLAALAIWLVVMLNCSKIT